MRTSRTERLALQIYDEEPMQDGDAVLLLDGGVCLELIQLADEWEATDLPMLREVMSTSRRVVLAIARRGRDLQCTDLELGELLRAELAAAGVDMPPVHVLSAA